MLTGSQPTSGDSHYVPALRNRELGVPSATRRQFLVGLGTTAIMGSLAGCLGGDDAEPLPAPVAGDPDGAVTLQVFSDFACPHCRTYHLSVFPTLEMGLLSDGDVRYEHHDFPIPVDQEWSWRSASAARAAQAVAGDEAFWNISEGLYQHQGKWSASLLEQLGDEVGADGTAVRRAGMQNRYRNVVQADRTLGEELGVPGTPAIMLDGQLISPSAKAVEQAVATAL
jgi:protein-disulfide isomerase